MTDDCSCTVQYDLQICVWSVHALYVDVHMWSPVCMLFCVTFEHVFIVKAWHVQLHKEFIGFSIFS